MFEQNLGSRGSRWLKWSVGAMAAYGICTLLPESRTAAVIGAAFAVIGIAISGRQMVKACGGE